jgi:hypothetical protein
MRAFFKLRNGFDHAGTGNQYERSPGTDPERADRNRPNPLHIFVSPIRSIPGIQSGRGPRTLLHPGKYNKARLPDAGKRASEISTAGPS